MNRIPEKALIKLRLDYILENWDFILKDATGKKTSYSLFLNKIIEAEYQQRLEKERLARILRARIPSSYIIETYPFDRQPKLNKTLIMEAYDSMDYMQEKKDLIFIGPTGCGKTKS